MAPPASPRLDPLAPVYLVHGPEDLLRAEALAAIAGAVLTPGLEDFNHDRFEGPCDLGAVVGAASTLPVMAERRLVEVRAVDRFRPEALAPLADYLKDPSPTTVLVIEGAQVDLRRTPFPQVKRVGQVVPCQPMKEWDAVRWVESRAKALGQRIEPEAARFLVAYGGTALATLAGELDKAAAYAGEGRIIDPEAVSETAGSGRVATVFELTDALGERRAGAALQCLGTLLEAGEAPLKVQGMIVRQFRLLWRAREALAAGRADLAATLGVHPFVAEKLKRQAPRHAEAELADAFLRFARVDFDLKGGAVSPRRTLEDEVLALCGEGRAGAAVSRAC